MHHAARAVLDVLLMERSTIRNMRSTRVSNLHDMPYRHAAVLIQDDSVAIAGPTVTVDDSCVYWFSNGIWTAPK